MNNRCVFSLCRSYRYTLEHVWDPARPTIMWIGLNPSTADENDLDPTLRRIRGFSQALGFGAFVMTNLFAYRATDPRVMKALPFDPVGSDNDLHLKAWATRSMAVVAAWGAHGDHLDRDVAVVRLMESVRGKNAMVCLGTTAGGHPKHPLYLAASTKLVPFQPAVRIIM